MMVQRQRHYGLVPDSPDRRDYLLHEHVSLTPASTLPARMDLRATGGLDDPVFDQGQLGSCTANAIASALLYVQRATKLSPRLIPSRLALYYWERLIEQTTAEDAGAQLRDGLKVVAGQPGYVDEAEWPYDVHRYAIAPPADVVAAAAKDRATKYMRVLVSRDSMRQALAAGFPVVVGFWVYDAIESSVVAQTGILPMPGPHEDPIGGHAVLLVGYDDAQGLWLCRNSWGPDWGQEGYFTVPYGYLDSPSYASDFWVIQQEVQGTPPASDPLHELAALIRQEIEAAERRTAAWLAWLTKHHL